MIHNSADSDQKISRFRNLKNKPIWRVLCGSETFINGISGFKGGKFSVGEGKGADWMESDREGQERKMFHPKEKERERQKKDKEKEREKVFFENLVPWVLLSSLFPLRIGGKEKGEREWGYFLIRFDKEEEEKQCLLLLPPLKCQLLSNLSCCLRRQRYWWWWHRKLVFPFFFSFLYFLIFLSFLSFSFLFFFSTFSFSLSFSFFPFFPVPWFFLSTIVNWWIQVYA